MYSVRWVRSALDQLSALWLSADSAQRERITSATSEVDEQLRRNPEGVGESRGSEELSA